MQNVSRNSNQFAPTETTNANDSFGNRTAHLNDHALSANLPERTWRGFLGESARKVGLGAAMMGAGLGLSGFGGVDEKKADAGIVISFDPDADQRARDNGAGYSVENGGNVGALRYQSGTQTVYSSLVFVNPYTAISTAHQFSPGFSSGISYAAVTGANYNSGNVYNPASIFLHPNSAVDFAVITFDIPVPISKDIVFGQSRPAANESVWLTGYGRSGSPDIGYLSQDGNLRAGQSLANNFPPLLGGSPLLYQNALFFDELSNPTHLRLTNGDSGGGIFNQNGELVGLGRAASSSVGGSTSEFLNLLAPEVRGFLDSHSVTAVPEPSSLVLSFIALGTGALAAWRRSRKT